MEKELVFITWSGKRSKAIAEALRDWLPKIIQTTDPWMSEHDIAKGTRWPLEIAGHLNEARFGLICLTPTNLDAPWLLFEAGALSKTIKEADAYVWTYLFDVEYTNVEWPLAQFQHTKAEKEDTRKLIHSINRATGGTLRENQLNELFNHLWPVLGERLENTRNIQEGPGTKRSEREMLKELLELTRSSVRAPRLGFLPSRAEARHRFMTRFQYFQRILLLIRNTICTNRGNEEVKMEDLEKLQKMGLLSISAKEFFDRYHRLSQFDARARLHDVPSHESEENIAELDILTHYLGPNPDRIIIQSHPPA